MEIGMFEKYWKTFNYADVQTVSAKWCCVKQSTQIELERKKAFVWYNFVFPCFQFQNI
jgi:hypothetical protein